MNLEEAIKKIEENAKKSEENALKIENNLEKIKENSGAIAVLHTIKTYNNRFFFMWIVTFCAFLGLLTYTIYIINDTGISEESSIEIQDVETIDNSHIKIGDDIWEKSK